MTAAPAPPSPVDGERCGRVRRRLGTGYPVTTFGDVRRRRFRGGGGGGGDTRGYRVRLDADDSFGVGMVGALFCGVFRGGGPIRFGDFVALFGVRDLFLSCS